VCVYAYICVYVCSAQERREGVSRIYNSACMSLNRIERIVIVSVMVMLDGTENKTGTGYIYVCIYTVYVPGVPRASCSMSTFGPVGTLLQYLYSVHVCM